MKVVNKKVNNLGKTSLVLGLLTFIYVSCYFIFTERTPNNLIAVAPNFFLVIGVLFINTIGAIIGLISSFQKVSKKTVSYLGIMINLSSSLFYLQCFSISAK